MHADKNGSDDYIIKKLIERDTKNEHLDVLYRAFAAASYRVLHHQDSSLGEPDEQPNELSELVEKLKLSRLDVEEELKLSRMQLDEEQKKSRAVQEEHYLKTHVVQDLHNEIMALTMQLNLSEEKRKKLQNELGR